VNNGGIGSKPSSRASATTSAQATNATTSTKAASATSAPSATTSPTDANVPFATNHDQFGSTPGNAGALATATAGKASTTAQIAALRSLSSSKQSPAKTAGARMAMLGISLDKVRRFTIRAAVAAAVGAAILPVTINHSIADTVYVNVNGATTSSPEYRGAAQAARDHHEPFIAIGPNQLESVLKDVESGKVTLRKLVPSGHSSGLWFSGTGGSLGFDDVKSLSTKYPKAFSEVQLFFTMSCNAGTEENSRQWMALFQNAHALVGFDHIAPASDRSAAGTVLTDVDRELSKVDFTHLTRDDATKLAKRLSQMPGVSETEFAIRLRTSDGNTVYYSKLNTETPLAAARDLADQLRPSAFTPYLDGTLEPPVDHEGNTALRQFYNASQDLLNALGRDDANDIQAYAEAQHEKEAALKLIYFDVVLKNVELHMRDRMNAASSDLAKHGVTLTIPKLTSRKEALAVAQQLDALPAYALADFTTRNAAAIALVDPWLQKAPGAMDNTSLASVNEKMSDARLSSMITRLSHLDAAGAPADVQQAAQALSAQLASPRAPVVEELRQFFDDGLVNLKDNVFPPDWITTPGQG
jgi:hypothetical protein